MSSRVYRAGAAVVCHTFQIKGSQDGPVFTGCWELGGAAAGSSVHWDGVWRLI